MRLHTFFFIVMLALIGYGSFGFTWVLGPDGNAETMLAIWGGALLSFVFGGLAYSFHYDRVHGETATRDAIVILSVGFFVLKFTTIVVFIIAFVMTVANRI